MKKRALVIDDGASDQVNRLLPVLDGMGFEVATVESCDRALLRSDELRPELIVLAGGLSLDYCEGRCLQAELSGRGQPARGEHARPYCKLRRMLSVPVLMTDSVPSEQGWIRSVEIGFDFYMARPFSYVELGVRARSLLRRHEMAPSSRHEMNHK
ncbi:MAG: hypothetical protein HY530_01380 [Chloroflexi bacterium]|nr:hypothetical protein [Chloroflexota bacterium]